MEDVRPGIEDLEGFCVLRSYVDLDVAKAVSKAT